MRTGHVGWGTEWLQRRIPGGLDCRVLHVSSFFYLLHFSSQAFAIAVPADETVLWVITPIALLVFVAHHRLVVR